MLKNIHNAALKAVMETNNNCRKYFQFDEYYKQVSEILKIIQKVHRRIHKFHANNSVHAVKY
jgi:predicted transcriptional regulator with HTH domain